MCWVFAKAWWNNATIQVTNVQNIIYGKFIQAEVADIIHIFTVEQHSFRFNIWWQPIHFSSQLCFQCRFDASFSIEKTYFAEILFFLLPTRKVFGLNLVSSVWRHIACGQKEIKQICFRLCAAFLTYILPQNSLYTYSMWNGAMPRSVQLLPHSGFPFV